MTDKTIRVRTSRKIVASAVRALPQGVRRGGAAEGMLLRAGLALLGRIKRAFVAKARGGSDEAGDRWSPLKQTTIAYGRRGRTKKERQQVKRPSQALTDVERDRWWYHYRRGLAMYKGNKGRAAALAWVVVKSRGARTLFDKYAGRNVEILRDTGVLLNSLSPGSGSGAGHPNQVLRAEGATIVVGTNVPYAIMHHKGIPGKLPQRRLWPLVGRWPQSWWSDILDVVKQGLVDATAQLIRNQGA